MHLQAGIRIRACCRPSPTPVPRGSCLHLNVFLCRPWMRGSLALGVPARSPQAARAGRHREPLGVGTRRSPSTRPASSS
jgi:hypothetical protein